VSTVTALHAAPTGPPIITPPHHLEAEQSVLGAVLIAPNCLRSLIVEERLRPEHFYRDTHRHIWTAMMAMSDRGDHVNVLTVTNELEQQGVLAQAGGPAAVDALTGAVPGLGGVREYARLVIDRWRDRQRLTSAYEQIAAIANHVSEEEYEVALQKATSLVALTAEESFVDPDDLTRHMWHWMDEPVDHGLPVPPELASLAKRVRFRTGHVTVIAGWSHHGKTLIASQFAAWMGAKGHKAVIWTNEDTPEELAARHYNRVLGIPAARIADRDLDQAQIKRIVDAGRLPFGVQPCYGWDATQIGRHIRQTRPAVAVVDHFHNLPGVGKTDGADNAMQALVAAAGQTPTHLIVVCQLNQERNKTVVRPAPVGRDLRGTGQIYNLAHTVLLIHRQEEEEQDPNGVRLGRAIQCEEGSLDVVKNKPTGKLGAVPVRFDQARLRFVEAML
jgi:replicative DNA helicase